MLLFTAGAQAQSTLQAQLEVNLGVINIDLYDGVAPNSAISIATGPNIPACSFSGAQSNYRGCMRAVLNNYNQQGIVGVRFQFGINSDASSTPFVSQAGALSANWLSNFSLFLQDLRAANLRYVSFTPAWSPWTVGNMTTYACITGPPYKYDFTCTSANANAVFYPWLSWALDYVPGQGQGGPYDQSRPLAYSESPLLSALPGAWQWSSSSGPLFNFFDNIFSAIAAAQLQVREVDLYPEYPMWASSIYGRLIYDNVQQVHPLDIINQIMQAHQLNPTAVVSTAASQPGNDLDCTSLYGDSALLLTATELLSAMTGGAFGRISGVPSASTGNYCGNPIDPTDTITGLPWLGPNVIDVHTYPAEAIFDPGWGWISNPNTNACQKYPDGVAVTNVPQPGGGYAQNCSNDVDANNPGGSSATAANKIYSAINAYVQRWKGYGQIPSSAGVIIGETDDYGPGGIGRDALYFPPKLEGTLCSPYGPFGNILFDVYPDPVSGNHAVNYSCQPDWKWHRPQSSTSASEDVTGFVTTGLNRPDVVLRPWAPVSWGTILTPAPLSGSPDRPYNVGGCTYQTNGGPLTLPASGTVLNMGVATLSNCQWSTGFTPGDTNDHSWFAITSGTWQTGPGVASALVVANAGTAPRQLLLTIAGQDITVVQNGAMPPGSFSLTSPGNSAASVPFGVTLTWSQSANATAYDVYFSGTNPPGLVTTLTAGSTSYAVSVAPASTFYWKVVARNLDGTYDPAGPQAYQFTTQSMSATLAGVSRGNVAFLEDTNGNGAYDAGADRWIANFTGPGGYLAGDVPVAGDWTGDGHAKVGIYRASTGQWFLDANNNGIYDAGDFTYGFGGIAGDLPVVGDWNGLHKDCVGIFRQGFYWILDMNCNGAFDGSPKDATFPFGGLQNDVPVVGKWTGGNTRVGVVRCYFRPALNTCDPTSPYPFFWVFDNADASAGSDAGSHQPASYAFGFGGLQGDVFVTGDWTAKGTSEAGVYRNGYWVLDTALPTDPQALHQVPGLQFPYGGAGGDKPVPGKW
jgi:hypothetical protein